jgi:hypothetical protein
MLLTVPPGSQQYILILITDKKVYPVYYGKAYKVKLILIAKFVTSAHCSLKIK